MDTAAFDKLVGRIDRPDDAARAATADLLREGHSFGRLVDAATWLSAVTAVSPPPAPQRPRLLIATPDGSVPGSAERVAAALGRQARGIALGAAEGAGESADAAAEALARGVALAEAEVDAGTDLLLLAAAVPGPAAPTLVAACTQADAPSVVAPGPDDMAWMRAVAAVRDGVRRVRRSPGDPLEMLAAAGGTALAQLTGVLLGAAARRTPVVIEGVPALAAALVLHRASDAGTGWLVAAHADRDPAAVAALRHLGLTPLLDLGLAPGPGVACALTIQFLTAAAAVAAKDAESP